MIPKPSERRRYPRVPAALPIRVSTIDAETDPWTGRPFFRTSRETCADLSRGGVSFHDVEGLVPGRRVLLELELPDGGSCETVGRVAWCRLAGPKRSHVGVEFVGGAPDQLARLERFLVENASGHLRRDGAARP